LTRKYLVVVRAGPKSLHPRLLRENPSRDWDCCVNWWAAPLEGLGAEYYVTGGDTKFEGLEMFLASQKAELPYRYILAVDDDVYFRPGDLSRLFARCDQAGLYLAQPALRWSSFFSHVVLLRNAACALRKVTFVEVMAPCFSAAALKALRHTFTLNKSTYAIDWAWTAECLGEHDLHVVDEIGMLHTKPIDRGRGAFYMMMRSRGIDPDADAKKVFAMYPDVEFRAATCREGHVFRGGIPRLAAPAIMRTVERVKALAEAAQFLRVKWRGGLRKLRALFEGSAERR
jgi:hypothetical protein